MDVSVIIPCYNSGKNLEAALKSTLNNCVQMEILIIDDGSDKEAEYYRQLEMRYQQIKVIYQKHSGTSCARNMGLEAAKGKYILYLDADDELGTGTIDQLFCFFESCGDTVDLITYPIVTEYQGKILQKHFRYKTLSCSGIYDIDKFPYIGQTTMNVMVRNRFEENILFDTTMNFSEDQKYCCDVLSRKLRIGFCSEASYIYHRSEESSSGQIKGACYIFEQSMKMFEEIFFRFPEGAVPAAFQGLYINDLEWKLQDNILFPLHYDKWDYADAIGRIRALLARVDNNIILEHPQINFFHKYFWLSMKPNNGIEPYFHPDGFGLTSHGNMVVHSPKVEIVVTRIRIDGNLFIFRGFLKSVVFAFSEKPELEAVFSEESIRLELYSSAHNYYLCHSKTNCFYAFCMELPVDQVRQLSFCMKISGMKYDCTYYFMPRSPFSHNLKRYQSVVNGKTIFYDTTSGEYSIVSFPPHEILDKNSNNVRIPLEIQELRKKAITIRKNRRIWLYYDCRGVNKDNGYYRFCDEFNCTDEVERYYIIDPDNHTLFRKMNRCYRGHIIPFGSEQHKVLFLAAEKILTAFIEDNNVIPFPYEQIDLISDFLGFEVVYLQHGILHASVPWKYTPEIIMADKVCVSTEYEKKLFVEKYHFRHEDILDEPMSRLKRLDPAIVPKRKILFAPSWRSYLIRMDAQHNCWQPLNKLFEGSDYRKEILDFLNSPILEQWLEKYDYVLEFHIHPVFKIYESYFKLSSKRVSIIDQVGRIEDYSIMITDFSSYAFDFRYLNRPVFSYIPDEIQFRCGMNSYHEIEDEGKKQFIFIKNVQDFLLKIQENNIQL